jgi:hypothetical protein
MFPIQHFNSSLVFKSKNSFRIRLQFTHGRILKELNKRYGGMTRFPLPSDGRGRVKAQRVNSTVRFGYSALLPSPRPSSIRWEREKHLAALVSELTSVVFIDYKHETFFSLVSAADFQHSRAPFKFIAERSLLETP